jgi:hypothetical protein
MMKGLLSVFLLPLWACTGPENSGDPASAQSACASRSTQREVDLCFFDALLATSPAAGGEALEHALNMKDPVIRGAAILKWVQTHNRQIPAEEGGKLCRLLQSTERTACERRLYSAHLQR